MMGCVFSLSTLGARSMQVLLPSFLFDEQEKTSMSLPAESFLPSLFELPHSDEKTISFDTTFKDLLYNQTPPHPHFPSSILLCSSGYHLSITCLWLLLVPLQLLTPYVSCSSTVRSPFRISLTTSFEPARSAAQGMEERGRGTTRFSRSGERKKGMEKRGRERGL